MKTLALLLLLAVALAGCGSTKKIGRFYSDAELPHLERAVHAQANAWRSR